MKRYVILNNAIVPVDLEPIAKTDHAIGFFGQPLQVFNSPESAAMSLLKNFYAKYSFDSPFKGGGNDYNCSTPTYSYGIASAPLGQKADLNL